MVWRNMAIGVFFFFFQAEDGIRDLTVTGVQTCALPISPEPSRLKKHEAPGTARYAARGLRHIGYPESRACALRSSLHRHLWTGSSSVGQAEAPASIPKQPRRVARFTNVGAAGQIGSRTDLPHCTSRRHFDVARATRLAPAVRPGELTPGSTSACALG